MLNYLRSDTPFYSRKLVVVEASFEGFSKYKPGRGKCAHVNCKQDQCTFTRFEALAPAELADPKTKLPFIAVGLVVATNREVRASGSIIYESESGNLVKDMWFQVGHKSNTRTPSHWYPHSAMNGGRFEPPSAILELPEILTCLVL